MKSVRSVWLLILIACQPLISEAKSNIISDWETYLLDPTAEEISFALAPLSKPEDWYKLAYQRLEQGLVSPARSSSLRKVKKTRITAVQLSEDRVAVFGDPDYDLIWFAWKPDPTIQQIRLILYDITNEPVVTLRQAGNLNRIPWRLPDASCGIYYYQLTLYREAAPEILPIKKIILYR